MTVEHDQVTHTDAHAARESAAHHERGGPAAHGVGADGHHGDGQMVSWGLSLSATLHCLTGCAVGEVLGMIIGTALGWSDGATIALAIGLAFFFGYTLTSIPLFRAGLSFGAIVSVAFAADTVSIAIMEAVDNGIMVLIPGAMELPLTDLRFFAALTAALLIAGLIAWPINRWLISKGRGHAVVHAYHS